MEEPARLGRDHQPGHHRPARRLAEDRDIARIAAEGRGVILHPAQRPDDIHEAVVRRRLARCPLRRQRRMIEEPEPPQPVVHRHHDHPALRQVCPVVQRRRAGAVVQPPTMDPHHDRQGLHAALLRRPDVQRQAILTHGQGADAGIAVGRRLDADGPVIGRRPLALPAFRPTRHAPAQGPDRRGGERHALVALDPLRRPADQQPLLRMSSRGCAIGLRRRHHQGNRGEDGNWRHSTTLAKAGDLAHLVAAGMKPYPPASVATDGI